MPIRLFVVGFTVVPLERVAVVVIVVGAAILKKDRKEGS